LAELFRRGRSQTDKNFLLLFFKKQVLASFMKTLTLHIGLPKTGTTYIQGWLRTRRAALAERGIFVPARDIFPHRLACEFIGDARRAARADVVHIRQTPFAAALDDLAGALRDARVGHCIVSSEYFFEAEPSLVAALRQAAPDMDIRIIAFLRRQDRIIESGYNQEVKAMGITNKIALGAYQKRLDWLQLFEDWAAAFGEANVTLVNFDTVARAGGVLAEFCRAAGLPAELAAGADDRARNESLPADLLEFKRLANMLAGSAGKDAPVEDFLARAMEAGIGGPPFRFAPEAARAHLAHYAQSNRALATRLGYSADEPLFPEHDLQGESAGADFTGHMPAETLAQLMALHIRHTAGLTARIEALERELAALRPQGG